MGWVGVPMATDPDRASLSANKYPPIRAAELEETHPEMPAYYRTTIGKLLAKGWPDGYRCANCDGLPSYVPWRCTRCGADLAGSGGGR